MTTKLDPPTRLSDAGKAMWVKITARYDLRADELRVLEDACREADLIDTLEDGMVDASLLVTGSQGQPVINPLVSELRQHRSTLATLLGKLKLPDEDGRAAEDASSKARAAANARWKRGA